MAIIWQQQLFTDYYLATADVYIVYIAIIWQQQLFTDYYLATADVYIVYIALVPSL
jgi:hypothetical protein